MGLDTSKLTKEWIQYLKGNRIVKMQSDPNTGKLSYNKEVTSDDLFHFLEVKTDFTDKEISNAMHMVLSKKMAGKGSPKLQNNPTPKEPGRNLSTWSYYGMRPGDHPTKQVPGKEDPESHTKLLPHNTGRDLSTWKHSDMSPGDGPTPLLPGKDQHIKGNSTPKSRYNTDDATDIEYRDKTPKSRWWNRKKDISEDIQDNQGIHNLDEKDIEDIFSMLASARTKKRNKNTELSPEELQAKKEDELRKIKRLIRDTLSDAQRKTLWRALNDM